MATDVILGEHLLISPEDDTVEAFLGFLRSAKKSIRVLIYGYHLPAMNDLLIEKHQAGVDVACLFDHTQSAGRAEHADIQKLIDAGVPFICGTSPEHGAIMHLKVSIIDSARVEHGSWNYSLSASYQANEMWFTDSEKLAGHFKDTFAFLERFILTHDLRFQPAGAVPPHEELIGASAEDAQAHIEARTAAGRAIIHHPKLAHPSAGAVRASRAVARQAIGPLAFGTMATGANAASVI